MSGSSEAKTTIIKDTTTCSAPIQGGHTSTDTESSQSLAATLPTGSFRALPGPRSATRTATLPAPTSNLRLRRSISSNRASMGEASSITSRTPARKAPQPKILHWSRSPTATSAGRPLSAPPLPVVPLSSESSLITTAASGGGVLDHHVRQRFQGS